jgi:histidinol-phosphate aminotransferase
MATNVRRQRGLDAIKPYVPGKPIEEVQREYGLTNVLKLASNENPLGPSPRVLEALQAALPMLNFYPDPSAYALCHALARRWNVNPDQVRVGNGADGVIREICVSYLDDGDEVIVSQASFPVYDISVGAMRGRLVKTPMRDYRLDLDAMAAAVGPRTKLIFVCNPNNPTGTMVTAGELDVFLARVPDHVLVVVDEAYYEFVDDPAYPDTLRYVREGMSNLMVLRTFSKSHGIAGLRLGYAIACADLLAPMRACAESFPVNRLALVAGEAALEDTAFLRQSVEVNRVGREYLYCEFARLGLNYLHSQGNFVLVHIGPDAGAVVEGLLRQGLIVRPCAGYDMPEWVRVTVGAPAHNERLVRALEKVLAALQADLAGAAGYSVGRLGK